jgi:peptide/nickel transport system substrate-binding protein
MLNNHIKLQKNWFIVPFVFLLLLSMITGCTTNEVTVPSDDENDKNSHAFIIGSPWTPKNLDSLQAGWLVLRIGLVDTLVSVDYNADLVPGLAKSWHVSDDGLKWTFKLQEGVSFHDGTPFNAEAVKFSLQRVIEDGAMFKQVPIKSIEAKNDHTVVITTKEPFAPLPAYLSKGNTAPISKNSLNEKGEFEKLIGTGPYQFDAWVPNQEVTLVKNEHYWGKVPKIDKVIYKGIPEATTRIMMLKNGELDMARLLPADQVAQLKGNPDIQVHTEAILRNRSIVLNTLRAPFDDIKVRKAINYTIDKQAIADYVMAGIDEPAKGPFPSISPWANSDIKGYPYKPDKAKQLLSQAGWQDTDNDGVLNKDGKRFEIDLITYFERAELPPMAEVIQSQLKQIGIQVNVQVLESGGSQALREKGDFDMYLVGRALGFIPDPSYYLISDFHSDNTGANGWGAYGYSNQQVDQLLEEGQVTMDVEKRRQIYNEVQQIIVDETPVIFISNYANVIATRSNVEDYRIHPTESSFHLENITIR